jgi:hypothetical protein
VLEEEKVADSSNSESTPDFQSTRETAISRQVREFIQWIPDVFIYIESGREALEMIDNDIQRMLALNPEQLFLILNADHVSHYLQRIRGFCTNLKQKVKVGIELRRGGMTTTDPTTLKELLENGVSLAEEFVTKLAQNVVGSSLDCPKVFHWTDTGKTYNCLRDLRKNHKVTEELTETVNSIVKELLQGEGELLYDAFHLEKLYNAAIPDIQLLKVMEIVTKKEFTMYANQSTLKEHEYHGLVKSLEELLWSIYYYFLEGL